MTSQSNRACCGADPYPQQWMAYVSGVTDKECDSCADFNEQYTFGLQGGIECAIWDEGVLDFCGWPLLWMQLYPGGLPDGAYELSLELEIVPDEFVHWSGVTESLGDGCTLQYVDSNNEACDWSGSTVQLVPVGLSWPVSPEDVECLCAMLKGCNISCGQCLTPPHLGASEYCCYPSPESSQKCGCQSSPGPPRWFLLVNNCHCAWVNNCPTSDGPTGCASCAPPGPPSFGNPLLDRPYQLIDILHRRMPNRPEWMALSPRLNPSNGNLVLQLAPPSAGAADPSVVLTYNSWSPEDSDYGYGWSNSLVAVDHGRRRDRRRRGGVPLQRQGRKRPVPAACRRRQRAGPARRRQLHRDPAGRLPDAVRQQPASSTKFVSAAGDTLDARLFGRSRRRGSRPVQSANHVGLRRQRQDPESR